MNYKKHSDSTTRYVKKKYVLKYLKNYNKKKFVYWLLQKNSGTSQHIFEFLEEYNNQNNCTFQFWNKYNTNEVTEGLEYTLLCLKESVQEGNFLITCIKIF